MHVPMALVVMALMFLAFGVWSGLRTHRLRVETQLRMDRCVKTKAVKLREMLGLIGETNDAISAMRRGMIPLSIIGLGEVDEMGMQGLVMYQDLLLKAWELEQLLWRVNRGCDRAGDEPFALPTLKLRRDPDDFLGPQTLDWEGDWPEEFYFELRHAQVRSTVRVFQEEYDENEPTNWRAQWSTARKVEKVGRYFSNPFSGWF